MDNRLIAELVSFFLLMPIVIATPQYMAWLWLVAIMSYIYILWRDIYVPPATKRQRKKGRR